jgi:MFS transporter, FHS family, Na+ dependent glucose transporter 1
MALDRSANPSPDRAKVSQTVAYYAAFVALGLMMATLGPTMLDLVDHTGTSLGAISYLLTTRGLGYLLGSLFGGWLYDRMAGSPVMGLMLIVMAVGLALVPLLPWLAALIVLFLVLGMTGGAVDVGGNTLLVWVHREKVGPFMNALHFFFGVGAFLAPLVIAQVIRFSPGQNLAAYWILALLVLPVGLALLRIGSPVSEAKDDDETGKGDKRYSANGSLLILMIAAFFFLYTGAESGFGDWIATYIKTMGLGTAELAAYLTSAFWGALTVGRLLSIPLALRFRPGTLLFVDLGGCIISLALILLWPGSLTVAWIAACGMGISMASIFPTMISFAERRLTITGQVTSYFFVGASTGGMGLPWLIGQLFEPVGARITMVVLLVDILIALALFSFLMLKERPVREAV